MKIALEEVNNLEEQTKCDLRYNCCGTWRRCIEQDMSNEDMLRMMGY